MSNYWKVLKDHPLKEYTTLKIGGKAKYFTTATTLEELREAFLFVAKEKCPFFILGKGSNTLFEDKGFNGLVILNKIPSFSNPTEGRYEVGAGYSFSRLGTETAREEFSGLEFASGIPGSVGGALYMNAGANGQETSETLTHVTYLFSNGDIKVFEKKDLFFSYRSSSFQKMQGAIVSGTFQLVKKEGARKKQLSLIDYRQTTQPYSEKSAGFLIESCGLKNLAVGDAFVSEKHANFICNRGEATALDVLQLVQEIKAHVKEKTGIVLQEEVHIIPYSGEF